MRSVRMAKDPYPRLINLSLSESPPAFSQKLAALESASLPEMHEMRTSAGLPGLRLTPTFFIIASGDDSVA